MHPLVSIGSLIPLSWSKCRVADKDWGADFRKLSAGSALIGLTLWLDHMQASSLFCFYQV
jgi:hypothetical protein